MAPGGRTPVHLRPLPLFQRGLWGGKGEIPKQIGEVRSVCIVMTATRIPIALEGVRSLILLHTMV